MNEANQESRRPPSLDPPQVTPSIPDYAPPPPVPPAVDPPATWDERPVGPRLREGEAGVFTWLLVVLAAGLASMLMGVAELGLLAALAGLGAVSHAIDLDPGWRLLRWITVPIVTAGLLCVFGIVGYGMLLEPPGPTRTIGLALALLGSVASLVMVPSPVARAVALFLFNGASHTLRLGARVVVGAALCCAPLWLLFHARGGPLALEDQLALGVASLVGSLVGMCLLALGSVGFLVRRKAAEAFRRLGLQPLALRHVGMIVVGFIALLLLNLGLEWVERRYFPALWDSDQRFNRLIAGELSRVGMVVLALSAGIGEELTLRGALQPRLGLTRTALLFAGLHVQYTWMGMLVIFALGMTLGLIRKRTNTTVAIAVHALYDLAAILTVGATR